MPGMREFFAARSRLPSKSPEEDAMKRLLFALLAWTLSAMPAAPALAADPLEGVLPLAKDDIAAVAQAKAQPGRYVMLFFGDQVN
jgi:hypothetical protein